MQSDTLTFDQVHLGVPDPAAAARWYGEHLGAAPGEHADRVMFGQTRFIFLKNDAPTPSQGAAIDHIGFSFSDLRAKVQTLQTAGVRVTGPAFIEDPWGTRIELVEDAGGSGFQHVHLHVPDPERARGWYLEMFGGSAAQLAGLQGLRYQGVWIFMERGTAAASAGHTIDHVGWRMPDLLAKAAALKTQGVHFTAEPHAGPQAPHAPLLMSFMEDPWGVKIELLQRREA